MTCKVKETFDYIKRDDFIRAHTDLVLLQLLHQHLQRKGEKKKYRVRDEQASGFSSGRGRAREGEGDRGDRLFTPPLQSSLRQPRPRGLSLCAQVSVGSPSTHLQRSPAGPGGQEPGYEEVELCKRHGERRGMRPGREGGGGGSPRGDCNSSSRAGRWRQGAAAAPAAALALARGRPRPGGFT